MRSLLQRLLPVLLVCLLAGPALRAQRTEETGTVSGRVFAADTGGPVRLASVVLIPAVESAPLPRKANDPNRNSTEPPRRVVQTGLDGTFTFTRVAPGSYYAIAETAGYLQPLQMLTREQMNKPDDATARLMARLLTPVTVTARHTASVEIRLLRAAALSGTVRYDDGTPASGIPISLWQRGKGGPWEPRRGDLVGAGATSNTDDRGSYRLVGLPAGEYLVEANLEMMDRYVMGIFGGDNSGWSGSTRYELPLFHDHAFRTSDAKPVKVTDGEEQTGLDLTVPLSGMHSLSGSVLAPDGHVANAATVALLWPDTRSDFLKTTVRADDNTFHFDYIPDGEYVLRVTDVADVTRTEVPNCSGCIPPYRTEDKLVRSFGMAEQPVVLHTDLQSVNVTVTPATRP